MMWRQQQAKRRVERKAHDAGVCEGINVGRTEGRRDGYAQAVAEVVTPVGRAAMENAVALLAERVAHEVFKPYAAKSLPEHEQRMYYMRQFESDLLEVMGPMSIAWKEHAGWEARASFISDSITYEVYTQQPVRLAVSLANPFQ